MQNWKIAGGIAAAQAQKRTAPAQPVAAAEPTLRGGQGGAGTASAGAEARRHAAPPHAAAAEPAHSGGPGAETGCAGAAGASAAGFYGQPRDAFATAGAASQAPKQAAAGPGASKASGPRARLEAKLGVRAKSGVAAVGGGRPAGGGTRPARQLVVPPGTSAFEAAFGATVDSLDVRDCTTR